MTGVQTCALPIYLNRQQRDEWNGIVNGLKICDPAVGSGHFLVSALNEIIVIKAELGILQDANGKLLDRYTFSVENDELLVWDNEENKEFQYRIPPLGRAAVAVRGLPEVQRVQETLFNEKRTIIENCLFGVDINPKSVSICQLRLWIELLKNAYYCPPPPEGGANKADNKAPFGPSRRSGLGASSEGASGGLQTLPNIDINIKTGNSLVSRYALTEDLSEVFRKQKFSLKTYQMAVAAYKEVKDKTAKTELQKFIAEIKEAFQDSVKNTDPRRKKLSELRGKRVLLDLNVDMFGQKKLSDEQLKLEITKADKLIVEAETEIADIANSKIYRNAFEWRFEFPEVLDDNGNFVGFDVIIGNPPYLQIRELSEIAQNGLKNENKYLIIANGGRLNLFQYFIGLSDFIVKPCGFTALIYQNSFLSEETTKNARKFLFENHQILSVDSFPERDNERKRVFEDVKMSVCITLTQKIIADNYLFNLRIWQDNTMNSHKKIDLSKSEIKLLFHDDYIIPSISESEKKIFLKLILTENRMKFKVSSGELDMTAAKPYFTRNSDYPIILKGAQIQRYFITSKVSQGEIDYLDTTKYFSENAFSGRILDSQKERIVMQRITGVDSFIRLIMTLVSPQFYCANSSNYIIDTPLNLRYLLGILNSRLLNYYFKTLSTNTNVTGNELEKLPIPQISPEAQAPFIEKVEQILALKKAGNEPKPSLGGGRLSPMASVNVATLEAEIDAMVYELYELTAEEIVVVEGR